MTSLTNFFHPFPAMVVWVDDDGNYTCLVIDRPSLCENSDGSIQTFTDLLQKSTPRWRDIDVMIIPLPEHDPDDLVANVQNIMELLEDGEYNNDAMFNMKAKDLLF